MQQSPELKDKIIEIYDHDFEWWSRIEDYLWNTWYVLVHKEYVLKSWKTTQEEMDALELEYKKIVDVILLLPVQDILLKLDDNKPSENWTNSNIESLKKAFLN